MPTVNPKLLCGVVSTVLVCAPAFILWQLAPFVAWHRPPPSLSIHNPHRKFTFDPFASSISCNNHFLVPISKSNMAGDDQKRAKTPPDDVDFFPYPRDERTFEDLDKYKRHGLHPIIPGDILPKPSTCVSHLQKQPRYTICVKIGVGAFSTVWLAQDANTR